jgi:ribonuclease HI
VFVGDDGSHVEFSGAAASTTNNRMEITAAIEVLRRLPPGFAVTIRTDSQYLVNTMTVGWKRRENLDLWRILDAEVAQHKVRWEWVRGHAGHRFNERADELARNAALGKPQRPAVDLLNQVSPGGLQADPRDVIKGASLPIQRELPPEAPALSNEETADNESEIVRLLRPLLAAGETVRRCAGCHRAFVATGNPPRMRAYCSLVACQLKHRRNSSG